MKKVLSNIFLALAALVFLSAVLFVTIGGKSDDIYIFGYKPFMVATGSMETQYMTHSLVVIQQIDYDEVQVDDAIAFRSQAIGKRLAFHRVVAKTDMGFVTKGDNNPHNDSSLVTRDDFIGCEVFHTNWTAYYMQTLSGPNGVMRAIVLPIIAIVLLLVGISLFSRWEADIWLKRLIVSMVLLAICIASLVSYAIWDSQRISYTNDRLREISSDFLAQLSDTTTVNNREVLGIIKIPSIDIEYPIIKYENASSLDISIAHYSGPDLNEIGNVTLVGHRSTIGANLFFTNIDQLSTGDKAIITDSSGRSVEYRLVSMSVHLPNDLSVLKATQDNDRELTLISCTADLQNRHVVKFTAIK